MILITTNHAKVSIRSFNELSQICLFWKQNIFYYLYKIYNLGTQTKCEEICEETDDALEQYCYENCETVDVTLAEALFGDNEDNVHVCENV